jgi:hypothetical protein
MVGNLMRRYRRLWQFALAFTLLLILASIAHRQYHFQHSTKVLRETEARLDATEPGWRDNTLAARFAVIPPEKNSVLLLIQLHDELKNSNQLLDVPSFIQREGMLSTSKL